MQGMFGASLSLHKTFAMRMRIIPSGIIDGREEELLKREKEVNEVKKVLEEEKKVHEKDRGRQYRFEREIGQLRMKITQWENEEEERERRRERDRQKRAEDEIQKRVRIEEEERDKVRQEITKRRKRP